MLSHTYFKNINICHILFCIITCIVNKIFLTKKKEKMMNNLKVSQFFGIFYENT